MKWMLLALPLFLFSCKKKDEVSPVVNITFTEQLSANYQLPIEINLSLKATDETGLQSISFEVRNFQNGIIAGPVSKTLSGEKETTWSTILEIDDRYITSGEYFISATARDERNASSDFYDVTLFEIPRVTKRYDIVVNNGLSSKIDSGNFINGFETALVSPQIQHLGFDPVTQGFLTAGNAEQGAKLYDEKWNQAGSFETLTGSDPNYFYEVLKQSDDGRFFTACFDNSLRTFNGNGNLRGLYAGPPNTRGRAVGFNDTYVIGAFSHFDNQTWRITSFFRNSSAIIDLATVPFEVLQIFEETENTFLLFGKTDDDMVWARFFINANAADILSETPFTENIGPALVRNGGCVVIVDNELRYSTNFQSFFTLESIASNASNFLEYDEVNNLLLFSNGNSVQVNQGSFPLMNQMVTQQMFSGPPTKIIMVYSK